MIVITHKRWFFKCPYCKSPYTMDGQEYKNYNGTNKKFTCSCGEEYKLTDV